jgi:small subunit ribosomal protein S1
MEQNNALTGQGVEPESKPAAEPLSEERPSTDQSTMETLLEEQGLVDLPKTGEVRVGVIAAIGENEILVSVGTKSEGVISGREFEQIPAEERLAFTVGAERPKIPTAMWCYPTCAPARKKTGWTPKSY